MSFPPYASYKDSGVQWLGKVPSGWGAPHLRRVCALTYGEALAADVRAEDGAISVFGSNGAVGFHSASNTHAPAIFVGRKGSCGALTWSDTEGFAIDTVYSIDRRNTGSQLRWLFWALHTLGLSSLSQDTGVPGLPREIAYGLRIPVPPAPEQRAIADFLDRETAKIDALVEAQRRLIALLKEKRQAVVSHAVTKGLDPSAPLKPSGIDWLDDVPAHWEVVRLRFLADITTGTADTIDAVEGGDFPFFVRSDVPQSLDYWTHDCEAVMTSGDGAGVGKIYHYFSGKFAAHQRVYIFSTFRRISGEFFYQFLSANFARVALEGGAKSTVDSLRRPLIANFRMTVPPSEEQDRIVQRIKRIDYQFNILVSEAESAVALLTERRAALISAAVTGKIDVQAWTAEEVRNAVGAEIVHLHARDRTFGRVQNQKLLFLAQTYAGVDEIGGRFQRRAAGPHDADLMASIEEALTDEGLLQVSQPGGAGSQVTYSVTRGTRPDRSRLQAMLGDERLAKLDHLLEVLADEGTRGVEAIATICGVWNDALLDGEAPDDERLVWGFMAWHPEKAAKFTAADVRARIGFMRRNRLVPEGHGSRTRAGALL